MDGTLVEEVKEMVVLQDPWYLLYPPDALTCISYPLTTRTPLVSSSGQTAPPVLSRHSPGSLDLTVYCFPMANSARSHILGAAQG